MVFDLHAAVLVDVTQVALDTDHHARLEGTVEWVGPVGFEEEHIGLFPGQTGPVGQAVVAVRRKPVRTRPGITGEVLESHARTESGGIAFELVDGESVELTLCGASRLITTQECVGEVDAVPTQSDGVGNVRCPACTRRVEMYSPSVVVRWR